MFILVFFGRVWDMQRREGEREREVIKRTLELERERARGQYRLNEFYQLICVGHEGKGTGRKVRFRPKT